MRGRKNYCTVRVVKHWNKLPREAVELPSLEIFKHGLGTALSKLLWVVLLDQGVDPDDLQRCLSASATLRSSDSVQLHPTIHKLITPPDISFCQTAYHHQLLCTLAVIHIACLHTFAVIHIVIITHRVNLQIVSKMPYMTVTKALLKSRRNSQTVPPV